MKRLSSLILSSLVTVLLFSCTEEVPDPNPDPDPKPDTGDTSQISKNLLAKTTLTSGSDVTTMLYQYDAQNRLVWYSNTSTKAGYFEDTSKIVRDNDGHIKQIVYRSDTSAKFKDPKLDSVVYNLFYNTATLKYTHKILQYKSFNFNFKDSAVYTYDAQSRIVKEDVYYFDYKVSKAYILYAKTDYTYDAKGDMTKAQTVFYDIDSAGTDYPFEITYTYDDKVNLLNLGNEAILIGLQQHFSAHNPLTMVSTYALSPQYNRNTSYVYAYNTKNRPLTAALTDAVSGVKSTMVFTYQ